MPRTGRLHIPGGCYHLIGRGLERRDIFLQALEKQDILARFGRQLQRTNSQCLAWALMSNHYHFLIRAGTGSLAKLMAPVLTGFAVSYNRRHERSGYVFQNRFTSILCDEESHLFQLIRYIHLNPLRAGVVSTLEDLGHYPWTGHAGLLGRHRQDWHGTDEVLTCLDGTRRKALNKYQAFMAAGVESRGRVDLSGGGLVRSYGGWEVMERLRHEHRSRIGDERILGEAQFVEKALQLDAIVIESRSRLIRQGWDLEKLVKQACDLFDIRKADLLRKSRTDAVSQAKAAICYWGTEKLGLKARDIADHLAISQPAVSKWVRRGREMTERKGMSAPFDELSY